MGYVENDQEVPIVLIHYSYNNNIVSELNSVNNEYFSGTLYIFLNVGRPTAIGHTGKVK